MKSQLPLSLLYSHGSYKVSYTYITPICNVWFGIHNQFVPLILVFIKYFQTYSWLDMTSFVFIKSSGKTNNGYV